ATAGTKNSSPSAAFDVYSTTHLNMTVSAGTQVQAGAVFTVTVTALDAQNAVDTAYRGTVRLTSTDRQAVLPADYTFTATDAGVKQFTVTLKTAGPQSVTVTDTLNPTITQSVSLTVTPGAVSAFLVDGFPTDTLVGDAHSFTVTAQDAFGN